MTLQTPRRELKNPGYEIFIAALSVLSLVNIVLRYTIENEALDDLILALNVLLSVVFLIDFLYRLKTAPSRSGYLLRGYGWADLLSSLPFVLVKVLRIFRLVRVSSLLNEEGSPRIMRSLTRHRAGSALISLLLVAVLMLEFGSLLMLRLEGDVPNSNITTASDALWYVIVTMATVGYGDTFPISNPGRILGTVIIVVGVGIFGTLTGYLANLFLSPAQRDADSSSAPGDEMQTGLQELRDLAARQQAIIADLESRMDPP